MRVAITGSSGLVGTALMTHLESVGHTPVRVVRREASDNEISWSPNGTADQEAAVADLAAQLEGIDAVVHLAGAGIGDKRWSDDYKRVLVESRTKGTALLANAIAACSNGPKVLLSGSAVGVYGARGDEDLDETSTPGTGFLADLTVEWEQCTEPATAAGVRVVFLRTGIVLSAKGGALKKQLPLFKLGAGGTIGSGEQWWSWISIDDEVRAITHLLTGDIAGPVNLTAPQPTTQADFANTLGSVLKRPTFLPTPKFGPKLLLGSELAENLLFTGQKVFPQILQDDAGFTFEHPDLETALRAVLGR
ncbi:TIGR01777 family oxidoreductase [uncultured Ilumatobacter sp.]|uniref:TIGR01777 family oxidoreductase n=1 Tax=uncultured Ilumatobacter sp. TaxID=879968 RepID=UPI00374F35B9